ncbi:MAG: hypothetical protein V3U73_02865 [bacterium]
MLAPFFKKSYNKQGALRNLSENNHKAMDFLKILQESKKFDKPQFGQFLMASHYLVDVSCAVCFSPNNRGG